MVELADTVFADGPAGSPYNPPKHQIRALLKYYETGILGGAAGSLVVATKAGLDTQLAYAANTMGWVIGDPVAANNGIYQKSGVSGTGSWVRRGDLPYSFIRATDAGAGTANAIVATSSTPLPTASAGALIALNIFETNTASPVTVTFNGGNAYTIKTNNGNNVLAGYLVAGAIVAGYIEGGDFRLISDVATSADRAAAETAAANAAASAAAAEAANDLLAVTPGTDITSTLQTALNAGKPVRLPGGEFLISTQLNSVAGSSLVGFEGKTILRRTDATTTATIMLRVATEDFVLDGVTFDGHKAVNANACNLVSVVDVGVFTARRNRFKNAKTSAGFGSGLTVNGLPMADGVRYTITDNEAFNNDGAGIDVSEASAGQISRNKAWGNGGSGITVNNYDTTLTQKLRRLTVSDNVATSNGGNGIQIANFLEDNVQIGGDYGYNNPEATLIAVNGNVAAANQNYGIAINGYYISAAGNVAEGNSIALTAYGGYLFSVLNGSFVGNTSANNLGRGVECGGCRKSVISGNAIRNNPTVGISIGAGIQCLVSGNLLENNGGTAGDNINCDRYDGASETAFFDFEGSQNIFDGNFFLLGNATQRGINLMNGVPSCAITGNHFDGTDFANFIRDFGEDTVIDGNKVRGAASNSYSIASNRLTFDDVFWGGRVNIDSAGTINAFQSKSMSLCGNNTGIGWIDVTAQGSGYTSAPTVVFTGGGGTGATAFAMITVDGRLTGIRMGAHGSGYTSAPTISFTGGGGTGATAAAQLGLPLGTKKRIAAHIGVGPVTLMRAAGSGAPSVSVPGNVTRDSIFQTFDSFEVITVGSAAYRVFRDGAMSYGTYTPTNVVAANANVAAVTMAICHWERTGNHVKVWGSITIDPDLTAPTATLVGISLPIASNLALSTDCRGTATTRDSTQQGEIRTDVTNDCAVLGFQATNAANIGWSFNFGYELK